MIALAASFPELFSYVFTIEHRSPDQLFFELIDLPLQSIQFHCDQTNGHNGDAIFNVYPQMGLLVPDPGGSQIQPAGMVGHLEALDQGARGLYCAN